MVLEFAPGGNLRTLINHYGALHENNTRSYFQQIVLAIDYCHKRKTCVRDLKLENLVLNEDLKMLKLCDFGLSKVDKIFLSYFILIRCIEYWKLLNAL